MERTAVDIMVFNAHPDDSEMAMGGTLIRMLESGLRVINISLTPSQMSTHGDPQTRAKEFRTAADSIGMQCAMLDLCDTQIENDVKSRELVVEVIREHRPKIVFAPYHTNNLGELGGVANRDHAVTGAIVRDAVKLARLGKVVPSQPPHTVEKLFFYMLPRNIQPSIVVDVTREMEKFEALVACYATQLSIRFQAEDIMDILRSMRRSAGMAAGVKFAEGFTCDVPLRVPPELFLSF